MGQGRSAGGYLALKAFVFIEPGGDVLCVHLSLDLLLVIRTSPTEGSLAGAYTYQIILECSKADVC